MPKIVDYPTVVEMLTQQGFRSLYFNSGAFGFAAEAQTISRGWIGKPDASIRESARALIRQVDEPFAEQLSSRLVQVWQRYLPGAVWAMPKSHWAFELEFGSRDWMPGALQRLGVDDRLLAPLNNAPAIAFEMEEAEMLREFVRELLTNLAQSDFQLVFPGRMTICTIHSRGQLWWTTADPVVAAGMDEILPSGSE
jgi:hypothetical protein